tara:strand:- start:1283 stop:1507 length:225 start_codon:yes stop_codon:yes gene_type:complete
MDKGNIDIIKQKCWDNHCYVFIRPVEQGRMPKVKLQYQIKGTLITGKDLYVQNSEAFVKKIEELYRFIYKKYVT